MFDTLQIYLHLVRRYLLERPWSDPLVRARRRMLLAMPLFAATTFLFLMLDRVFFPSHRRVAIRRPLFVIGNPRSGTTLLHRLLSQDREHVHGFRTWEIAFPSIIQQRIISWIGRRDARRGGRLRRRIEAWETRAFSAFADIHQVGMFLPEEDGNLLLHILAAPELIWFFPPEEFGPQVRFDREIEPGRQRRILDFYAGCVRRHAFTRGGAERYLLSKNPFFTGKIMALRRTFPDCRFVCLVRNPLETIPSLISLTRAIMKLPPGPVPHLDRAIYNQLKDYYLYALEHLDDLPPERCAFVTYEKLLSAPEETVRELYRRFGMDISPAFATCLAEGSRAMRGHRSSHRYSLQDTAITRQEILDDLKPVFDRFAFRIEGPA